jgi:UDP-2,3-diacylglucosamine hydrolase
LPDQHFGAPTAALSLPREKRFVAWLDEVKGDRSYFSSGYLFDFGSNIKPLYLKDLFVLGKLAEIRDSGIPIYFS